MKKHGNQIWKCDFILYGIIALLSAIVFCMIYGVRVLNPVYTDWLLIGGDLSQHYIGWKAYRSSDWMFPIGMTDCLVYPDRSSVIFTDSIPAFAVLFKMLSPVLPGEFQYFGYWGMLCFVLQGCLSARIVRQFTKDRVFTIAAGVLFALTPVMIKCMYWHTALAGQWILLLVLEPLFVYRRYAGNKKIYGLACMAGILAASVHIYFVLMCGMILAAFCLADILVQKRFRRSVGLIILYILSGGITVWLLGGFSSSVSAEAGGLGIYSFNLNALFNPQGWSCIYQDLPLYGNGQYEGFAYLGAGCIWVLVLAAVFFLHGGVRGILGRYWKTGISILFLTGIAACAALSPVIAFADYVVFEAVYPEVLLKFMSIFRATGRISWIIVYVLMLVSAIILAKCMDKRVSAAILMAGIALQTYDMHIVLGTKAEQFHTEVMYDSPLKTEAFWEAVAGDSEIGHIVFAYGASNWEMYAFGDWAFSNRKTLNTFYMARSSQELVQKRLADALKELPESYLFVFHSSELLRCLEYDLNYYEIDGYVLGSRKPLEGVAPMARSELQNVWTFGKNRYLQNGEDEEDGRVLYAGGLSFGPYWSIPAGNYSILIEGEDILDKTQVVVYSQGGGCGHDFRLTESTEDSLVLSLQLKEDVDDLEICVRNIAEDAVRLKSIRVACMDAP